nr:DUF1737 domain-containing protein [Propionibacterium sp.]
MPLAGVASAPAALAGAHTAAATAPPTAAAAPTTAAAAPTTAATAPTTAATAPTTGAGAVVTGPPSGERYRCIVGQDDAEFSRRVSAALAEGYRLHGEPTITVDGQRIIIAQAVVWPG